MLVKFFLGAFLMKFLGGGGLRMTADVSGVHPNQLVCYNSFILNFDSDDVFGWWWAKHSHYLRTVLSFLLDCELYFSPY